MYSPNLSSFKEGTELSNWNIGFIKQISFLKASKLLNVKKALQGSSASQMAAEYILSLVESKWNQNVKYYYYLF